jgi:dTDP-glucose 4,6-dehydratase/UDP-glucose 4-epimerase
MKIIIIGSKGFIGQHAVDYFRRMGHDVYGCDVVTEYNDDHYFQVEATNASFEDIFLAQPFEVCINCSGAASVPDSFIHPFRDFHLNSQNVFNILEAIRKHAPGCKFLSLSSAAVYGNPAKLPIRETDPVSPVSPYGWHKRFSEMICEEFYRFYKIPTCSVRIFSAFGPGLQKQIFWDWYQKISRAPRITLFGTGRESRDFIFIGDIVQALACVVRNGAFRAETINVGNGEEIRIDRAIGIFKNATGVDFHYDFNNEVRQGDPLNWAADISALRSLGYVQETDFEAGIKSYIQWIREKR